MTLPNDNTKRAVVSEVAAAESKRRADLAKIHLAKKHFRLSQDDYAALLIALTGKSSAADLDWRGLKLVNEHFVKLGFKPASKRGPSREAVTLDRSPVATKARAIWLQLHELGVVRDKSEQALMAYARRLCKVDALQWLSQRQMMVLIESLKDWAMRHLPSHCMALRESISELLHGLPNAQKDPALIERLGKVNVLSQSASERGDYDAYSDLYIAQKTFIHLSEGAYV